MVTKISESHLLQARLRNGDRPVHIYFSATNHAQDAIFQDESGAYCMNHPNRDITLILHGAGSPALYFEDGSRAFIEHGLLHRWGGPAVEHPDFHQYWLNGIELSVDDYAECKLYDIWPVHELDGSITYVKRTEPHCIHRVLGPAHISADGTSTYYSHGVRAKESTESPTNMPLILGVLALAGSISAWKQKTRVKHAAY